MLCVTENIQLMFRFVFVITSRQNMMNENISNHPGVSSGSNRNQKLLYRAGLYIENVGPMTRRRWEGLDFVG